MSIVRQPNGLYAVFSPITNNFVLTDSNRSELIEFYLEDERDSVTTFVDHRLKLIVEMGAVTAWERALRIIERTHGKEARKAFEGLEEKEMENGESEAEKEADRTGD